MVYYNHNKKASTTEHSPELEKAKAKAPGRKPNQRMSQPTAASLNGPMVCRSGGQRCRTFVLGRCRTEVTARVRAGDAKNGECDRLSDAP